jgi:hypothetical protein
MASWETARNPMARPLAYPNANCRTRGATLVLRRRSRRLVDVAAVKARSVK